MPARIFGVLSVLAFGLMFIAQLPNALAGATNFVIGFALAGSVLGLAAVPAHLPRGAVAIGTSIIVTAAFVFGGAIQPIIGFAVEAPLIDTELVRALFGDTPSFNHYQRGVLCLLASVAVAAVSAFFLRRPAASGD